MDIELTEDYIWIIKWLDVSFNIENDLVDVVKRVHWVRSYVNADIGFADIHGVTNLPNPNPQSFLNIEDIDIATVKSWLNTLEDTIVLDQELISQFNIKDHAKTKVVILLK
jgi:hypothetical protein